MSATAARSCDRAILLTILALAAALRLAHFGTSPPGLNQDEAANGWNAYCVLKTGRDQVGVSWPIFYSRFLGENRTTLYMYALLPFQAVGGLNITTTRLPNAVGGVLTVWLVYFIASRLFDHRVGLVAALLLAVCPWHVQQSRWGHEAGIVPLLITLPLAVALAAQLPLRDGPARRVRPLLAGLAGLLAGVACYGYPCVRLFMPLFIVGAVLATCSGRRKERAREPSVETGDLRNACMAAALGFVLTFGPLAFMHLTDPNINKRGDSVWVWRTVDSLPVRAAKVIERYAGHYGLDFLFVRGDAWETLTPPGGGMLHWYMLPLLAAGMIALLSRLRSSRSAALITLWLIVYPAGDCLSTHASAHALRSLPGVPALMITAAVGTVALTDWLKVRQARLTVPAAGILAAAALFENARFVNRFFGEYNGRGWVYHDFQTDLVQAYEWLRPTLGEADAVFVTKAGIRFPYITSLVVFGHDPKAWFREPRDWTPGGWDVYRSYGKIHFLDYEGEITPLEELQYNNRPDRVYFVVRPGELGLGDPLYEVHRPDGEVVMWVCVQTL